MIDLPKINEKWIEILSSLCRHITGKRNFNKNIFYEINLDRCKPTNIDIENRQQILKELEKQFKEDYSDCNLHAFGSFYNGFGFRQSDLDVCIVFKDEREQTVCISID